MSSGKSTLINALLGKKLMPSKNEACTATITEILDNDMETFAAVVHDEDDVVIQNISELTYEIMSELNDNENVHRISATGNIPFLDAKSTALMLVDTPGPNNSQNQAHKNTTFKAINNDSNKDICLMCYEKPSDFCHRHLVANWLNENGIECKEWS